VNALANPAVGKYINEYFCSSFQKVGTFRIVGRQKQGGNVAAYFCAPDGRVLHCVAGPVNANVMLREAKWVIDTTKKIIADSKGDGGKFKAAFRRAHAQRLRSEYGMVVEPVTFDLPDPKENTGPLTYSDPSGRPLAPKLQPAPIDGPDVTIRAAARLKEAKAGAPGALLDRRGRGWVLPNQARVHTLLAAHSLAKIEKVYGAVFEGILGERISTKPVEVVTPFPWVNRKGQGKLLTPRPTR
jgi:hypothetical protein